MSKRNKPWRHTWGDMRGPRDVFLNGDKVDRCVYADTRRGVVIFLDCQLSVNRNNYRIKSIRKKGAVEVVFK